MRKQKAAWREEGESWNESSSTTKSKANPCSNRTNTHICAQGSMLCDLTTPGVYPKQWKWRRCGTAMATIWWSFGNFNGKPQWYCHARTPSVFAAWLREAKGSWRLVVCLFCLPACVCVCISFSPSLFVKSQTNMIRVRVWGKTSEEQHVRFGI